MIHFLNTTAEHWFDWQFAMLWQTAVLIGIVWVVDLAIRKWAWPQVRYALWMLVLVKLLIPPTWTSPASVTSHIPELAIRAATVMEREIPDLQTGAEAATGRERANNSPPVKGESPEGGRGYIDPETQRAGTVMERVDIMEPANVNEQVAVGMASSQRQAMADTEPSLSWQVYVMFAWLAGMIVLSTWLLVRLTGLRREHCAGWHGQAVLGRGETSEGTPTANLTEYFHMQLQQVAQKLNLKRIPQVVLTDKVVCPAVFGIFRPVLLMPAAKFRTMSTQDTEHILLHELAHIKRGDLLVHAVWMLVQIVYWFNPLLWMIRRTLQNLRELCCDATVARLLRDNTSRYRQTLLETARQLLAEPVDPGLGLLGLFENNNWLVIRLQWLEKNTWKNRRLRIVTIIALVAIMTTCVLPMGLFDPGEPEFVIKGRVTDSETGSAIAGAKVGDKGYNDGKFFTVTDSNGNYEYKTWYEEHGIAAEADGYHLQRKGILTKLFGSEKERVIDFSLIPTSVITLDKVLEQADKEARALNHEYIGTEHLLAALVSDENLQACKVLKDFGVDAETVRTEINKLIKPGSKPVTKKRLSLTPRAKKAIKYAQKKGESLGYNIVTSEYILLGLLQVEDSVAAGALENLGISYDDVHQKINQMSKEIPNARQTQAWVEDFFKHNYRDITARKTLEWGKPKINDDGTISMRYKYEATIWDKDKIIENKVWTFDKNGNFIHVRKVGAEDIYSLPGAQALVEDFFANNYRDITKRKTLEWGEPVKHENGNVSIRYKYEATIWDADTVVNNEIYTFDKNGKFISVKKVGLKELDTYKNVDPDEFGITVYKVNKAVSSFPESVDFSLPENTYVMANRIIAEGNEQKWPEISASGLAARMRKTENKPRAVDADKAKKYLNAKIVEVHHKGVHAGVVARFPGILPSYDTRSFKRENGKWLNRGNSGARTLATARAIIDQGIDYRNFKETENTQNPALSDAEGSEQFTMNSELPTANCSATLSNGVIVELVGVCEYPGEGPWWKADGTVFESSLKIQEREDLVSKKPSVIVFRVSDSDFRARLYAEKLSSYSTLDVLDRQGNQLEGYRAMATDLQDIDILKNLEIQIASGPWQTIAEYKDRSKFVDNDVVFSEPVSTDFGTLISATGEFDFSGTRQFVAYDKEGNQHQGGWAGRSTGNRTITQGRFHGIKPDQITKYQIVYRPYEIVTFKNVSLHPGVKTDVKIENIVTSDSKTKQFNWVAPFEITKQNFLENDWIEITEISGPTYLLKVGQTYRLKGKYKLSSREKAMLHIYATNGETQSEQGPVVERGTGEFTRTFTYLKEGWLHLSFYPAEGGSSFGSLYFAQEGSNQQVPDISQITSFVHTSKTDNQRYQQWVDKISSLDDHKRAAFVVVPQLLEESSDFALRVTQDAWPNITSDKAKQGVLKAFHFAKHPHTLGVLDMGVRDLHGAVVSYALTYVADYSGVTFPGFGDDYVQWYEQNKDKSLDQILVERKSKKIPYLDKTLQEMVEQFTKGAGRTDLWDYAQTLGDAQYVYAIPSLIGIIDADNSYDTIYGVGYFGLTKITGVDYSCFHDGPWWRRWWQEHKGNYPKQIQETPIPELPKTAHGYAFTPYPDDIDTPDGMIRWMTVHYHDLLQGYPDWSRTAEAFTTWQDPIAIPYLIAAMDVSSDKLVYDIGYHGLDRLTGVPYEKRHDAAWWKDWWQKNKSRYPEDVQALDIEKIKQQYLHPGAKTDVEIQSSISGPQFSGEKIIQRGDVLEVSVYELLKEGEHAVMKRTVVDDGTISLHGLPEPVQTEGFSIDELRESIIQRYKKKKVLKEPFVEVTKLQKFDQTLAEKSINTLEFKKERLFADALRMLSKICKVNIIPSQEIIKNRDVIPATYLYDVTFEEALKAFCGTTHTYEIKGNFVYVYTNEEYDSLRKSRENASEDWDIAFSKAMDIVMETKDWPQGPVAVSEAFWQARADKEYDTLKLLWPGSASWDQSGRGWKEICEEDSACEYVFGQPSENGTQIPYAAKEYFEQNGSYNLKMLLGSVNTKFGKRYYIISAN